MTLIAINHLMKARDQQVLSVVSQSQVEAGLKDNTVTLLWREIDGILTLDAVYDDKLEADPQKITPYYTHSTWGELVTQSYFNIHLAQ